MGHYRTSAVCKVAAAFPRSPRHLSRAHPHLPPHAPRAAAPPSSPKHKFKPPVPPRADVPVMGLMSDKNWVVANAVEAITGRPTQRVSGTAARPGRQPEINYTQWPGFGKVGRAHGGRGPRAGTKRRGQRAEGRGERGDARPWLRSLCADAAASKCGVRGSCSWPCHAHHHPHRAAAQVPTYLRRNKAAIADEQQQIETFLRMRGDAVRRPVDGLLGQLRRRARRARPDMCRRNLPQILAVPDARPASTCRPPPLPHAAPRRRAPAARRRGP